MSLMRNPVLVFSFKSSNGFQEGNWSQIILFSSHIGKGRNNLNVYPYQENYDIVLKHTTFIHPIPIKLYMGFRESGDRIIPEWIS
jgi:hypothetical protein